MTRPPPGILAIIGLCAAVEVILTGADLGLWGTPIWRFIAFVLAAFNPAFLDGVPTAWPGQIWGMFALHPFLHVGPGHMASNMLTLLLLVHMMPWMSQRRLLAVYGLSAVGGALAFSLLAPPGTTMTGASGAISGLAGVWLSYEATFMLRGQILRVRRKRLAALALLLALTVLAHAVYYSDTAWQAHFGGAVTGMALAALSRRPAKP